MGAIGRSSQILDFMRECEERGISVYAVKDGWTLPTVSFIMRDSKRFVEPNGWGYAQFGHDAASDTFKPFGSDSSYGKDYCHKCHTLVNAQDYIFTGYPRR